VTTPEERAEKIHAETCGTEDPRLTEDCIAWIAAKIREAVEEATKYLRENDAEYLKVAVLSAYEDAANIAEQMPLYTGVDVADRIRARAKELQ
jgi:hypothetical protein